MKSLQIDGFTLTDPYTEVVTYFLSYLLAFPVLSQLQLIPFGEGKAELHVAFNMPRVYKPTVKREKKKTLADASFHLSLCQ